MSAHIVDNGTIRRALRALAMAGGRFNGYDLTNEDNLVHLGQELFKLNTQAVNICYRSRKRAPQYQHGPADPTTPAIQLYKSLYCLIYQCSEGKVMTTWLYKKLQEAREKLATILLEDTQAYKSCGWE